VWFLRIIPDQVFHEFSVEVIRFIEVIDVEVNTLLLDGAVESLQKAIRLRMPGVVKEVGQLVLRAEVIEVASEFTAIISLDASSDKGRHPKELPDEITAISRRIGLVGVSKGEAGADIEGSENIAL